MKKIFLVLIIVSFASMFIFSQQLQLKHYKYSDICEITTDDKGKIYTNPFYSDNKKEIFLETDKNGYSKLKNNEYYLFFIDGMDCFIDDKIDSYNINDLLGNANLNGRMIKNIKASSTLTDKYHTYSPEGTLFAWYTGDCDDWGFVKDNIPWVEGKEDYGIGEYLEFELNQDIYKNNSYNGWIIRILNGYVNPEKPHLYKENSNICTFICDICYYHCISVTLAREVSIKALYYSFSNAIFYSHRVCWVALFYHHIYIDFISNYFFC